ncbi:O-succinylhomoserine sulfhydrylase [Chromobacterium subtsugae]|mgnify:CR=1 FL=1|uniref:O-succinylhomoserine sulfhydrylase n=1 Tax=Chromobacterium subtsugae TaxID=251747 RepID=A0ABS7FJI5_9NEIS|nr:MULTISPECIES: O-succinylhomoserine sulfhydrylase [Chromobacterium]KUM03563.1 O-succinylhomoserine sulfhydrylase [Chromobacterium subtsugae]KZE88308.1 O-succinylhomoserine sulfhydrylase [Chromobacterium sp. F49]MBW7568687.1 O-succinylhomoserine sulfhydrylase [Chromobacterium subtsugae]MBW8289483.1 O-succinylhomoserine sulfhydrylase [Chromobacterium subtsugae]OBU85897.1 O-succinylhomoserine sulfhydrylase [Chromobacterium subtsugae]
MSDLQPSSLHPETQAIRAGRTVSEFGEHSQALYLTSSFTYESAAQAAAMFLGEVEGYTYSRFTNPTVAAFQQRLAAMEGGERAIATATGMAAIQAIMMTLLKAGDHIVSSQSLFGSTTNLFAGQLSKFGVATRFVDARDLAAWRAAITPETRLLFLETPSNPLTEVADVAAIAAIAHEHGALLVVDNSFCSPALQQPLALGADLVMHSATKFLDGHGRVMGGAVVGSDALIEQIYLHVRAAGPSLSPFNAWTLLSGMETLHLRMEKHSANALELARWLESLPQVERVYYPGLESHPQHELARRQQKSGGAVVSFVVKGGREAAWRVVDAAQVISRTANLGDVKSTITHPASTTHARVSQEARDRAGIVEGLLRVSVGLENVADLKQDLLRGLD